MSYIAALLSLLIIRVLEIDQRSIEATEETKTTDRVYGHKKSPVCPGFFSSRGKVIVLLFLLVVHLFGSICGTCSNEQSDTR